LGAGAIGYTIYGIILGAIMAIILRVKRSTGEIKKW
jgi:hypothetical protein